MRLYQCRNCSALFANPKGESCPACEKHGPTAHDVNDEENSYQVNWYKQVKLKEGVR